MKKYISAIFAVLFALFAFASCTKVPDKSESTVDFSETTGADVSDETDISDNTQTTAATQPVTETTTVTTTAAPTSAVVTTTKKPTTTATTTAPTTVITTTTTTTTTATTTTTTKKIIDHASYIAEWGTRKETDGVAEDGRDIVTMTGLTAKIKSIDENSASVYIYGISMWWYAENENKVYDYKHDFIDVVGTVEDGVIHFEFDETSRCKSTGSGTIVLDDGKIIMTLRFDNEAENSELLSCSGRVLRKAVSK